MSTPLAVPRRVPSLVDRAVRAGWEVSLTRHDDLSVDLILRETTGLKYSFDLSWDHDGTAWRAPRTQSIESVIEYITRTEKEKEA